LIKRIINGKIYSFQFGIKCVILPKSFSKINSDEARKLLFTEILIEK